MKKIVLITLISLMFAGLAFAQTEQCTPQACIPPEITQIETATDVYAPPAPPADPKSVLFFVHPESGHLMAVDHNRNIADMDMAAYMLMLLRDIMTENMEK